MENIEEAKKYFKEGLVYNNKGEIDNAIKSYTKAIKHNPNDYWAYVWRGLAYYEQGKYDKAIGDFTEAIKLRPNNFAVYAWRAATYYEQGKYDNAIDDLNKAIDLDSDYHAAYGYRGKNYFQKNDYVNAKKDFISALKHDDKTIHIYFFIDTFISIKSPNEIFDFICNIKEIWDNDSVYNYILTEYTTTHKTTEEIKKLWFYQYVLLYTLSVKSTSTINIATYLDIKTLRILLNIDGQNEKEPNTKLSNKLRLTSLTNANDIKEGGILFQILENNCKNITCDRESIDYKFIPAQRSFTRNKDSLTMFRLYGKNEGKEADGACLVFNKSFFNTTNDASTSILQMTMPKDTTPIVEDEKSKSQKLPLYYVLYYDKETQELIYNPNKSKYDNIVIDLKSTNRKRWHSLKTTSNKIIANNIQYIWKQIFTLVNEITKETKENFTPAYMLLINLHYLIKDSAFFEEAELRLLQVLLYDNDKLKNILIGERAYKDYSPLTENNKCHIKEIILGNKAAGAYTLAESLNIYLQKTKGYTDDKGKAITASVSKLPLR